MFVSIVFITTLFLPLAFVGRSAQAKFSGRPDSEVMF